jgi:hypothetical protein
MMCRGHSHTRMYYKKKHLLLYSFVFLPFSCLLLFFWHFSSVFLSFSSLSSSLSLFVDIRTAMFFVYSMPFTSPCMCVSDGRRERERESETMRGLHNDAKCLCVCVRALIDYIFYLSMTMMRTRKTLARARHCCRSTSNRPVVFFLVPPFLRFLSNVKIFFARHHRTKEKNDGVYKIDR